MNESSCPNLSVTLTQAENIVQAADWMKKVDDVKWEPDKVSVLYVEEDAFICEKHSQFNESGELTKFKYSGFIMIGPDGGRECIGSALQFISDVLKDFLHE